MKQIALAVLAVSFLGNFCSATEESEQVPAPSAEKLQWPDYSGSSWVVANENMMLATVRIPLADKNDYVVGPAKYDVRIGTQKVFMNPGVYPPVGVAEVNILGNGPVLRALLSPQSLLALQLFIDGKWQDIPPNWKIAFQVDDPKEVVYRGKLRRVTISVTEGDVEKLKVVLENKLSGKSRK